MTDRALLYALRGMLPVDRIRPSRRRFLRWGLIAISFGVIGVLGLYFFSWRFQRLSQFVLRGHIPSVASPGSEAQRVVVSDSPRIVADHYAGALAAPLVVLVHGSDPAGRREPLCRLLAWRLHSKGYRVLAPDLRGFGQSEPPSMNVEGELCLGEDLAAVARYATERGLARGGLAYVGHSFGSGAVLAAARLEPRPLAVAVLGAPSVTQLERRDGTQWRRRLAAQSLRHMGLGTDEALIAAVGRFLVETDVLRQIDVAELPPLLVVYGAIEGWPRAARDRIASQPGHRQFHLVPRADHRYQSIGLLGDLVIYDAEVLEDLTAVLTGWLARWGARPASP